MGPSLQQNTQEVRFRLIYSRKRESRALAIVLEEARLARIGKEVLQHLLDSVFPVLIWNVLRSEVKEPCVRKPRRPHSLELRIADCLFGTFSNQKRMVAEITQSPG